MNTFAVTRRAHTRHGGYSLIEVLIALAISLFLLAGLFTLLQGTRRNTTNQQQLAQLQDEQRLAMSLITDVIQSAGYYDSTSYASASNAFAGSVTTAGCTTSTLSAGQYLCGTHTGYTASTSTATPDALVVRYGTTGSDNLVNCAGNTSATATTFVNVFTIDTTNHVLQCSPDGKTTDVVPVVYGVADLQILYGVATGTTTNSVDTYMTATQVNTASAWSSVSSARVTLIFINPLAGQPGQPTRIYFTRDVAVQLRAGVTLAGS